MKILLINSLYSPYRTGGAETIARKIVVALVKSGHTVDVLTTKPAWSGEKHEVLDGAHIHRFFPCNIFWFGNIAVHHVFVRFIWHIFDTLNIYTYFWICNFVKKQKPDIVLTHNLKGIGFTTIKALKKTKCKVIHTVHDVSLIIPSGLMMYGHENSWEVRSIFTRVYRAFNKQLFASCDTVIFPTKFLMEMYVNYGIFAHTPKKVLANPVDDATIITHTPNTKLHLLFLGQIETHKGIIFLINVLKQQSRDFLLHIVGTGQQAEAVSRLINGDTRFIMHGFLQHEQLSEIFSQVDLLVFPSLCYENFPTVIIESLSRGVAVVASNIGGVSEIVPETMHKLLFEPNNAEAFLEALDFFQKNRETIQKNTLSEFQKQGFLSVEKYITQLFE